jgi:hypothetical protein
MQNVTLRRAVAIALAGTGALHLALAPEYLSEHLYAGILFVVGGLAALVVAAVVWAREEAGPLAISAVIALGMGVGFVLSRTAGLPGFHESEWEASGVLSLLLEVFVVVGAAVLGWTAIERQALIGR